MTSKAEPTADRLVAPVRILIEGTSFNPPESEELLREAGILPTLTDELAKNRNEKLAIAAAVMAVGKIARGLGLPEPPIHESGIRIMSEREFWNRWGNNRQAFVAFGRAFQPRPFLFYHFLLHLTHEIAHLASFRAVVEPARGRDKAVVSMRSGISYVVTGSAPMRRAFSRLNEGVTELAAGLIRRSIVPRVEHLLDGDQPRRLALRYNYPAEVRLVKGIVEIVSGATGREELPTLLRDYFGRTSVFLSRLAAARPGSVGRLARIERDEELLDCAKSLGFNETAVDGMRRVMEEKSRRR
jgi:hypothetical protein